MDCADAKLRMEPYATGNLASPDREEFEKHVSDCESCRLELDLIRAGVGTASADEAPASDISRSGEPDFGPGAAFGASSDLDEASFADVASQLSADYPGAPMADLERTAAPLRPPGQLSEPPAQLSEPPAQLSEPPARPAQPPARISEPPARLADPPAAPSSPEDFSLDELLANATPSPMIPADTAPEADPLAQVLPAPPAPARPPDRPPVAVERQTTASWDFEPAETARKVAPPEGSLFFAEETLARARDAGVRRKGGAVRFALWVAGGAVGLGLLVFAGWIAWTAHATGDAARRAAEGSAAPTNVAPPEGAATESPGEAVEPAPEETAPAPPEEPPAPAEEAPPAPERAAGEPVVSASTTSPPSPLPDSERPARARTTEPSRREAPLGAKRAPVPATSPGGKKPLTTAGRSPRAAAGTTSARGTPAARPAPVATLSPRPAEPPPRPAAVRSAPSGETAPPAPVTRPERAPVPEGTRAEPGAGSPSPGEPAHVTPESEAPGRAPSAGAPEAVPSPARGEPPEAVPPAAAGAHTGAAPAPPASSGAEGETAPPSAPRPVDRLHLATAAAEQRGDLAALRNMRATWKNFLRKSGVGPDRVRAKRELADCLWAIQEITGRRSDQQDAFRAYRDYLLNAPAGGADSRSVSRAKQLQDALSESN